DVRALGKGEGARRERQQALGGFSRPAHYRGSGRAGLRCSYVDRRHRTRRHAPADRAQAQRVDQPGDRETDISRALRANRRRARRRDARGVRRDDTPRLGEVGRGREAFRGEDRLIAWVTICDNWLLWRRYAFATMAVE